MASWEPDVDYPDVIICDLDKLLHEVSWQVGAMSVLTKPVSAEELGHHIEKAVGYAFA